MKKKKIIVSLFFLFVIVFFLMTVSAVRLPIVGGDSGRWGTVLNEYLNQLFGANATYLNVSNGTNTFLYVNGTSGNVGIGTDSPATKLDLVGGFSQSINATPVLVGAVVDSTNMNGAEGVYVSGKYAYVASYGSSSLTIVDISNPANPVVVGSIIDATNIFAGSSVFVSGKYAYVTGERGHSLAVVDVSNPANPVVVGSVIDAANMSVPEHVYVSGKYAYVAADSEGALVIIDISDPTNPVITKSFADSILAGLEAVYVKGKYAYTVAQTNNYFGVVDISDPVNPFIAGNLTHADLGDPESVYVSGRYAYVAGESKNSVSIIDISNSTSPSLVSTLVDATYLYNPEELYAAGKYLYVVGHGSKDDAVYDGDYITIVDVSNSSNPVVVGSLEGSANMDVPYSIYVSGKYAYVASQGSGCCGGDGGNGSLAVIDIFGVDVPSGNIGDLAAGTLDVWENAQIANDLYVDNGLVVGPGGIFSGGSLTLTPNSTSTTAFSIIQSGAGDILNLFDSLTEIFTILDGGNVGIGTTSPSAKLEVNGTDVLFHVKNESDSFLFVNATSGNVGMGGSSPARTLHINDTLRIEPVSAAPGSASLGDLYVDSDSNSLCFYNSTDWIDTTGNGGTCA